MGRIVLSTNMTLDGIGQDPTGEEGAPSGGWFDMTDADREAWAGVFVAEAMETDAILLAPAATSGSPRGGSVGRGRGPSALKAGRSTSCGRGTDGRTGARRRCSPATWSRR